MSSAVIIREPAYPGVPDHFRIVQRYVPLSGRYPLEFSLHHSYRLVQRQDGHRNWVANTAGYYYQLRERSGPEIIAFHWHPNRRDQPDFPHLHIRSPARSVEIDHGNHVPTGVVSLQSVVRFAIVELGVRPLRPDWEAVLDDGEQHFATQRSC